MTDRDRAARRPSLTALIATAALVVLAAGCGKGSPRPVSEPSSAPVGDTALPPSALLAASAAKARDRHYTAIYRYAPGDGSPVGTAKVERTATGVRVDLTQPADATSVARTTVAVRTTAGSFLCVVTQTAKGCVPAASRAKRASQVADPRLQHAFDDWLAVLSSPAAALSVATATPPKGVHGTCYSVEGVAASLDPPADPGLYCFDDTGLLTALRLAGGALALTAVGPPPGAITLPAPVTSSLPSTAAPPPSPSASPSASPGAPSVAPAKPGSTPTPQRRSSAAPAA